MITADVISANIPRNEAIVAQPRSEKKGAPWDMKIIYSWQIYVKFDTLVWKNPPKFFYYNLTQNKYS